MKPYEWMTEAELQEAVANYLVRQYPGAMFHSDFGSGIKLTPGQAVKQKRQNGGRRAWPDMFIAQAAPRLYITHAPTHCGIHPNCVDPNSGRMVYYGLYIELKKEGTRLKKKNGDWATEHIAEQAGVLEELRQRGYCAEFAVGFGEAKKIIDEYLGGEL